MTDDELQSLLRSALPDIDAAAPARDLFPEVVNRIQSRPVPHWMDIVLAVGIGTLFVLVPQWFFMLSYHL